MDDATTSLLGRLQEVDADCTPEERSLLRAVLELAANADPETTPTVGEADKADVEGFGIVVKSEPDPFPFDFGQGALLRARKLVDVRGAGTISWPT